MIGPNGAGKTTLFNVACGFVRPDAGTITWGGRELRGLRPHQLAGLGIARTLQGLGLFDRMTVLDNVLVGADAEARAGFLSGLLALPRSTREEASLRARALALLDELGIAAYADRLPGLAALRHAQEGGAGAGAGQRARAGDARRAGRAACPTTRWPSWAAGCAAWPSGCR